MEKVRWVAFCFVNPLCRAVVHFYPSGTGLTAPYSADCSLSIFGAGIEKSTVVLEGARLSQPDGVRLDDAFPAALTGFSGVLGIEISISASQARVDLSGSQCLIDLVSRQELVRFRAKRVDPESGISGKGMGITILNSYQKTSLLLVNNTSEPLRPRLSRADYKVSGSGQQEGMQANASCPDSISPYSAIEVTLDESWYANSVEHQYGNGELKVVPVMVGSNDDQLVYYSVYRDKSSSRPISVAAV